MLSRFFCAGINFQKADIVTRGLFSLDTDASKALLQSARQKGLRSALVLSTCNRTEWYGYAAADVDVGALLADAGRGTREQWKEMGFVLRGREALQHIFEVAAGLDSQIKGDYEILGQLKKALATARECGMVGPVMDRTVNYVIQASKTIKTNTKLSAGTVSVSFAAIEWLRQQEHTDQARVLLIGLGKFGTNVARNIHHYYAGIRLTVVNRTDAVAEDFARQSGVQWRPFAEKDEAIREADTVIICSQSTDYLVTKASLEGVRKLTIVDLSVPASVDPEIVGLPGIRLANVDEVSAVLEETTKLRLEAVPEALAIIQDHKDTFIEWLRMYRHTPYLQQLRQQLGMLHSQLLNPGLRDDQPMQHDHEMINNTVQHLARNLRVQHDKGCQYIGAFNHFLNHCNTKETPAC